jgi:restriction system protein
MYGPILDVLREFGGEAQASEVRIAVADRVVLDPNERQRALKSGDNAVENEVAWARNNLREFGYLESPIRGTWKLTSLGWQTNLDLASAISLGVYKSKTKPDDSGVTETDEASEQDAPLAEASNSEPLSLLDTIKSLPPSGFERLCQRILREAGFAQVTVTGKSGDGGIDGHGVLQINELVSFQVLFQCKRYQGTVGAPEIRNFRGAMSGRTDKGIFITTGFFSSDARKEAAREGVAPIELVDGEKLIALMERLEIGVKPRTVYDVDEAFFEPFRTSL